jgi:hypothetical protein
MTSNPPLTAPNHPAAVPVNVGEQRRQEMHKWALWAIAHHTQFTYTEGPQRWHMVESKPGTLPQFADCSAFVTGLAKWAGATDPNGLAYKGGYTGTLLTHCNHITKAQARVGDLIVYGPGTGTHVVMVLERLTGGDFHVVSHGHQGDPGQYLHSHFITYFGANSARYLRWLS